MALAVLYLAAVALLFASHVREFADESDNLLGGLLLARGARLYVDYFSSHMPFAYYLAALPALFGATRLEHFRLFSNALLVLTTLGFVAAFGRRVGFGVMAVWAVLTVYAHTLQFGEMLTAGTTAGFGALAAGLLFYSTPGLRFDLERALALSAAVFVAIQSELLAIYPLAVLAVAYLYVWRWREPTRTLRLALLVLLPNLLALAYLWATGSLGEFVYDAVQFNQTYYSQYLMSGSPLQMLHDWEAQYRTYLLQSLTDPLGVQAVLVVGNAAAAVLIGVRRGWLVGVAYYAFVALSHIRTEDGYYLVSYVSLALLAVTAASHLRRDAKPLALAASVAGLALVAVFVAHVARSYDFAPPPARPVAEQAAIEALTAPGERIFVAPYDPYVYLASARMPATTSPFYFPWQAIDPRSENRLIDELRTRRPPVVVFRQDESINGQWLPREYGRRVLDALAAEYVAPDPRFPDVLVPRDRAEDARQRLTRLAP